MEHIGNDFVGPSPTAWYKTGQHGVTIFFVISGFLITSKLLENPADLKRFYIRRFFRLMPAAWTFLGTLFIFGLLLPLTSIKGILACLFSYRNFLNESLGRFDLAPHFWSLSMEEQFYIFWPCLLFFAGVRRARWVAGAGAITCALYRTMHWVFYSRMWFAFHTEVRADALLVGCLMALLFDEPSIRSFSVRWSKYAVIPSALVLIFCIHNYPWLPPLFECVAVCCLIAASTQNPKSILSRLLSLSPLVWLGTLSYSVYVWQQPFLTYFPGGWPVKVILLCLLPLFAIGSFYLIERPCVRLGHRLTQRTEQASRKHEISLCV